MAIDIDQVSVDPHRRMVRRKLLDYVCDDIAVGKKIIGMQQSDDIPAGHTDPFVQRIVDPLVLLPNLSVDPIGIPRDNTLCPVIGHAVDNDVFDIRVGLL